MWKPYYINVLIIIHDINDNKSIKNRSMKSYFNYYSEHDMLSIREKHEHGHGML